CSSMKKIHRNNLTKNRLELVHSLYIDEVLQFLVQEDILSDVMVDRIYSKPTRFAQNVEFLTCLNSRGPRAYNAFKMALRHSCQEHLADMLEKNERALTEIQHNCMVNANVSNEALGIPSNHQNRVPQNYVNLMKETPNESRDTQDGHSKNRVRNTTLDFFNGTFASAYKMASSPSGLALIVSNSHFLKETGLPTRMGAEADKKNLLAVFNQLNFTTILVENSSAKEMEEKIREFSRMSEHRKNDSCAVVLLSHGNKTDIYGSDGLTLRLETIIKMFDNVNCPLLQNKPKIFFVQSCRGNNTDLGVDISDGRTHMNVEATDSAVAVDLPACDVKLRCAVDKRLPTCSDMIIGYATLLGNTAIRNTAHGSWYIQALVKSIAKHAHDKELLEILTLVNHSIKSKEGYSSGSADIDQSKEMSEFQSTLCKKLYFYPGIVQKD
uniref:Uncharacterized protein n=1 Tax=Ciona savignyi TaxID=51511 RepID=H2YVI9_CIOSA